MKLEEKLTDRQNCDLGRAGRAERVCALDHGNHGRGLQDLAVPLMQIFIQSDDVKSLIQWQLQGQGSNQAVATDSFIVS